MDTCEGDVSGMLMNGLIGLVIVFLIVAASSEKTEAIVEIMEDQRI